MDIDEMTTRPRDDEGVPGDALDLATVGQKSGTAAAPMRPAMPPFDHSRYEIREATLGGMTIQVYQRPARFDGRLQWWSEVYWRGHRLWIDIDGPEMTREAVETAARERADSLREVVYAVSEVVTKEVFSAYLAAKTSLEIARFDRNADPTWTALPDEIAEPRA
ncbi:hypothetical protein [Aureimonas pseudogalii]|uniref:Uncharacterized protein n=1 Tax=Aureimonas pseudogalii TaxID=1744844 RepID=A0A7W6H6W5_9HYPH|nr:hypothetical protein [Aureimonas pseudogalii]MBB3999710.1 hypothetical protein [Aureimonas pseudogalii]